MSKAIYFTDYFNQNLAKKLLVYLATSWAILEAVSTFSDRYLWTFKVFELILVALVTGLVMILIQHFYKHFNWQSILFYASSLTIALATTYYIWQLDDSPKSQFSVPLSEKSVMIIPFESLHGQDDQYLTEGIYEDLISNLSKVRDLQVISKTTAMRYKDQQKTTREIAEELGVRNIVEGTVRMDGDRVRFTAKLIDTASDEYLWSETFNEEFASVVELQGKVASKIARALQAIITPAEEVRLTKIPTKNPDAYTLYLKGKFEMNKYDPEGLKNSLDYFDKAIEKDPQFALAYAGKARTYSLQGTWIGEENKETDIKSAQINGLLQAQKALQLDPDNTVALTALANINYFYRRNIPEAEKYYKRAYYLDKAASEEYGFFLIGTGKIAEALDVYQLAYAMNPLEPQLYTNYGLALISAGRRKEGMRMYKEGIRLFPNHKNSISMLAAAYSSIEEYKQSQKLVERYNKLGGETKFSRFIHFQNLYGLGKKKQTQTVINEMIKDEDYVWLGIAYVEMGQKDVGIDYFERAYEQGSPELTVIRGYFGIDTSPELFSDQRFTDLLKKLGFDT